MAKHVAFIRAINVAGHARVKMDAVKTAFTAAGCQRVTTFIQSGNVLFDAPERSKKRIVENIRKVLRQLVGEEATVLFRTLREVNEIVKGNPFADVADSTAKLYVVFLAQQSKNRPSFPLRSEKEALEAIRMTNLEVFVVSGRKSSGFYGFPNNFIEKELGVPATSRNWSTVSKIAQLGDG
jgi:uncharacterized protein (DUF1697 family)